MTEARLATHRPTILIVDDDPSVTASLGLLLKRQGYATRAAASPAEALEILQREIEESQAAKRSDAKQRRELDDARLIQRGLLPTTTPQIPGLRLASSWRPANGVGGDCFDMLTFGTGRTNILFGLVHVLVFAVFVFMVFVP